MTDPAPRTGRPRGNARTAPAVPDHVASDEKQPKEVTPSRRQCNVPGCDEVPEWRGLCSAHRQTHRGLAGDKDPKPGDHHDR